MIWDKKKYNVCKEAFMSIFDIDKDRIKNLNEKRTESGTIVPDQRGIPGTHNAHTLVRVDSAHGHIGKIPVRSSHYTRHKNPHKQFIDSQDKISVKALHDLYWEYMAQNYTDIEPVSESYYRKLFNTCYNISSEAPKTDTCDFCEVMKEEIKKAKENNEDCTEKEEKLKEHKEKADVAYKLLASAKCGVTWDPTIWLVVCIDVQQTFMIPKTAHRSHFYERKLNVYNFCIVHLQESTPYFYIWEEFTGRRGSCEIFSCIYKFLKENVLNKQTRPRKFRIIADNCGRQNKNNNLVLALLRLVHLNLFDRIELAFMVPGHSYLPCDRTFGNIGNKLRTVKTIHSPDNLVRTIQNSTRKKKKVHKLTKNKAFQTCSVIAIRRNIQMDTS